MELCGPSWGPWEEKSKKGNTRAFFLRHPADVYRGPRLSSLFSLRRGVLCCVDLLVFCCVSTRECCQVLLGVSFHESSLSKVGSIFPAERTTRYSSSSTEHFPARVPDQAISRGSPILNEKLSKKSSMLEKN